MDARVLESFRRALLQKREALLREVEHVEEDLRWLAEDREAELEEQAQEERSARLLARLDMRGKAAVEAIDRALARIDANRYGECAGCGGRIPQRRLAALPTTPYCRSCAEGVERGEGVPLETEEAPGPRSGVVPPDYSLLTERELEDTIREQVREDGRIDMDELRIVCRHGVVHLDGCVPSEGQRQILGRIVTDVMGLVEVVDRLQVKEILWERHERSPEGTPTESKPWEEASGTEDITQAQEEGTEYVAPAAPEPDEQ